MDLVGVIEILLIALIQIASVKDSCQTSQTNVPFKTSFVSSSDYSVRRNVGALISLPLSNIETPHQPEALMSGSSFEPTFHEQTFSALREPIVNPANINSRDETSLNPSNQAQNVNSDYQGEHYGSDQAKRVPPSSFNYSQEPVVVVEVQASRQSQQPEETLINTHYSQVDDLVASPSAEMSHNASQINQTSINMQQTATTSSTTITPIITTIQSKLELDNSTRRTVEQETTTTFGPSSSTVQATMPISPSSPTTASTTTTTTTTIPTTTLSATTTAATESSPTTTSPPSPLSTTMATINRSTITTTTQSEVDVNTTVMARPESSTALVSPTTESAANNDTNIRAEQASPQTSQINTQTTHIPSAVVSTTTSKIIDNTPRGAKKVRENNINNSDRNLDQEMFLSNRSSVSSHTRAHICKFGEPNCSYIVATVPVIDRWNSGYKDQASSLNNTNTRVVNEFVFVPEDSGLNFEDPSFSTRKSGTKDIETSSLKAEHRTIDNEGETTSNLSDDIELDYTNPESDTTKSEQFAGKSAANSVTTVGFNTTPRFSTPSSSYFPTYSSPPPTSGEATPSMSQTMQPTTNNIQISHLKSTTIVPMTTTSSSTTTKTPPPTTIKITTPSTTTMAPSTTKRSSPSQPSTLSSTSTLATSSKPTTRVSQSTSYTVRVSSSQLTSILPQTTPAFRVEEAVKTTRKPVARLNQKILRINDQSVPQFSETPQQISRILIPSSTAATTTTTATTSSPMTLVSTSALTAKPAATIPTTATVSRVNQSTIIKIPQENPSTQVRTKARTAQQAPIPRRPKASSNSYGEHKQFLSEPITDLRRKSSSAVGNNFSPSFNGADDEETKILTRYTIPSQLSRLTAPKSATETKRSVWLNQRVAGKIITTTNNQQSARNKLDQANSSEKLAAGRQIPSSSPTTGASKDQLSIEINKKQQHSKRLQVQTMANILLDDKHLNRQAQASLTVMAQTASNRSDQSQVGQSQAEASMRVSSFSNSPVVSLLPSRDNDRSSGLQSNLSEILNASQTSDKQQVPTATAVPTTTDAPKQLTSTLEQTTNKKNSGEVMFLIASSPNLGSMPALPLTENFSIFSSIGSLNRDYKESSGQPHQQQKQQQQQQQQSLRRPDQQVDKIIELLKGDLAAEKTLSLSTTSTTPRSVQPVKIGLSKPVRRLVEEVDDFEGSIEDQLEKDALHSRPQNVNSKTTPAPMASKRSNTYTKAPRQNQSKQQQQQQAALQDSGKWIPSAEDAAGSGIDTSESGNNSGNLLPGRPGVDYPIHWQVPKTSFDCRNYELSGFYADIESDCQAYHSCHKGRGGRHTFLCPNGTLFSQELLTCDWWYNVECSASKLYLTNDGATDNLDRGTVSGSANSGNGGSVGVMEQGSRTSANELSMAA